MCFNYDYIKMCVCVCVCVYCASRKQLDERRVPPHPSNQAIVVLTENLLLLLFVGVSGIKSVLIGAIRAI